MKYNPGIGATPDLSLRVSIATLVRVIFKHPINDEWMLALERKATLREDKVEIKSQPFGGAIRILDLDAIHDLIGDFHFDSEHSRAEQDFRLFIRPSSWSVLREFCIQHLSRADDPILETDPDRELTEEFFGALKVNLQPEQYVCMPVATLVENEAAPTENIHANGYPTVRVYRIFEASVTDPALIHAMLKISESSSHEIIRELVLEDARNGGKGRVNTILALPLKRMYDFYRDLLPEKRNIPITFENDQLDETICAILDGVAAPKYQTIS
jgi:hypothetical protein